MGYGSNASIAAHQSQNTSHGCDIKIHATGTTIYHVPTVLGIVAPTVRSYKDGIKIGCTFVTNEAVELIYNLHKSYLDNTDSKTHQ